VNIRAIFVGILAGAVSALLYAAVTTGGGLAMPLALASPLPIAIVSLGWGSLSGFLAAVVAGSSLAGLFVPQFGFLHFVLIGAPIAIYGHLAGLARPTGPNAGDLEWYPLSRVLTAMTLVTPLSLIILGAVFGFDTAALGEEFTSMLEAMATSSGEAGLPPHDALVGMFDFIVRLMPFIVAMFWLAIMAVNLWLAGKITRASHLLARPVEIIADTIGLAKFTAPLLIVTFLAAFGGGPLGLIASTLSGALAMGYGLIGLAVLHVMVRGSGVAPLILSVTYIATYLVILPLAPLTILGLLDRPLGIRRRRLARPGGNGAPPTSS
jgi:hypothetical protein